MDAIVRRCDAILSLLRNRKVKVRPDCGKKMADMTIETPQDAFTHRLEARVFAYVARFACSEQRVRRYLLQLIRRDKSAPPDAAATLIDPILEKLRQIGALDDRTFAGARAQSLARRGQGKSNIAAKLSADGIDRAQVAASLREIDTVEAAVKLMMRRRLGPYRLRQADDATARRELAAMMRAGHPLELSRRLLGCTDTASLDDLVVELRV